MPSTPAFGRYAPTHAAPRQAPKALLAVPLALAICAGQAGPAFASDPTAERTDASSTSTGAEQRASATVSAGRADAEAQAMAAGTKEAAVQVKAQAQAAAAAKAQAAAEATKAEKAQAAAAAEKAAAKQEAAEAKQAEKDEKAEKRTTADEMAADERAAADENEAQTDEPKGDDKVKGSKPTDDDKVKGDNEDRGDDAVVDASSTDGLSVTVTSTKALSNVVLRFCDGTTQKFDGLSGNEATFSGTGENAGKLIDGVFIKSGNNASGAGPGFGEFVDVRDCETTTGQTREDGGSAPEGDEDAETGGNTPAVPNDQTDAGTDAPAAPGAPVDNERGADAEAPVNNEVPADTEADVDVLPTTPTDRAPVAGTPATPEVAVLPTAPTDRAPVFQSPVTARQTAPATQVQVEAGRVSAQSSTASRVAGAPAQLPFTGNETGTLLGSGLGLLLLGFVGQLLGRRRYMPLHAAA